MGSVCVNDDDKGECSNIKMRGNINKIDLYEGYWKGFKDQPIPSGFTMYTDEGQIAVFGADNNFVDGESRPHYKK